MKNIDVSEHDKMQDKKKVKQWGILKVMLNSRTQGENKAFLAFP